MNLEDAGFSTKLIHVGEIEDQFESATVPIYQTSTFRFKSAQNGADCFSGASDGYIYTRIANPTIDITDIDACAALAREHGLVLVVDNTFCTPYLQKPLDL